jgi:hypothetical protein
MLAFSIVAILALGSVHADEDRGATCNEGEKWADGKIKMECIKDGVRPTGKNIFITHATALYLQFKKNVLRIFFRQQYRHRHL